MDDFEEADGLDIDALHRFDTFVGSVEGANTAKARYPTFPHAHRFVSVSVAIQAAPLAHERIMSACAFERTQELPTYSVCTKDSRRMTEPPCSDDGWPLSTSRRLLYG